MAWGRRKKYGGYGSRWGEYVPVAKQREKAQKEIEKLRKKGVSIQPVSIEGRTISRTFWGKGWCGHIESFSDFSNRLPRGRRYARNGSVCHLELAPNKVQAMVSGSSLYEVEIKIDALPPEKWQKIKKQCAGNIGSMIELLQGRFSDEVMSVIANREEGLFPLPDEIHIRCSCPDYAYLCKHAAAVLYGVGNRLDSEPETLFLLRGVDAGELFDGEVTFAQRAKAQSGDVLKEDELSGIFGIELEPDGASGPTPEAPPAVPKTTAKKKKGSRKKAESAKPPKTAKKKSTKSRTAAKKKATKTKKATIKAAAAAPKKPVKKKPFKATGKNIRLLRERMNMSGEDFAHELGMSPATIYRWESISGQIRLRPNSFARLEEFWNQ